LKRLKVPPVINQFSRTLDSATAKTLFNFLVTYSPENKKQKKERLLAMAKDETSAPSAKPVVLKYGLNHITTLIEQGKAKLVIIAHDVDPIELVMWIPTACRKKNIPYLIVKGKARLGKLVHKKTASCVALTDVHEKDQNTFDLLRKKAQTDFLDRYEDSMTHRGGGIMGYKHNCIESKRQRAIEKDKARTK